MIWLLVQHLVNCALLAVLVLVACRLGRVRPSLAHLLWLMVLVRLVVPPVVAWPWHTPDIGMALSVPAESSATPLHAPSYGDSWEGIEVTPAVPLEREGGAASALVSANLWAAAGIWALATWITGGVFLAVMQMLRLRRFSRVFRTQQDPPEWLVTDAGALAERFSLPTPRLCVVDGIDSPLFYGWRRPAVLIPKNLIGAIPREQWNGVLAHELAHWKRRDHWVGGLELIAGCLWWWNPVFWMARHHLRQTAELACDAWVIWALPDARKTYAKTLVDISEIVSLGDRPVTALGIGQGSRRSFERRLSMVMRSTGRTRISSLGVAFGLLLLALSVPVFAGADTEPATSASPTAAADGAEPASAMSDEIQKALDTEIAIEFEDEHVTRALGFIAEYVDTNFVVDYRVVQPPKTGTAAPSANTASAPIGYVTDGMIPRIKLSKVPLSEALSAICAMLDLAYEPRPEYIWISTKEMIGQTDFGTPAADADPAIADKLKDRIAIEFESEHIASILEFISDYVDANIVLDKNVVLPPAFQPGRPDRPGPSPTGAPFGPPPSRELLGPGGPLPAPRPALPPAKTDPVTPVTPDEYGMTGYVPYISLRDVSLSETLKALLLPLNLTYRVEPGWIFVTKPAAG